LRFSTKLLASSLFLKVFGFFAAVSHMYLFNGFTSTGSGVGNFIGSSSNPVTYNTLLISYQSNFKFRGSFGSTFFLVYTVFSWDLS
jgi:hypothetical protein